TLCVLASPPLPYRLSVPPSADISTLSLHDALPISRGVPGAHARGLLAVVLLARGLGADGADRGVPRPGVGVLAVARLRRLLVVQDRKSTRLNSSHVSISYAVFCLKRKIIEIAAYSF